MARSRDHFCTGNTTNHSWSVVVVVIVVVDVDLHFTVNYIKIMSFAQQCFYATLPPVTMQISRTSY
jgi:hypothetical protein